MEISIIIPIYNKERYVKQCLKGALSQNFEDYEVIAVDDGSTDSSGIICDDVASEDGRLRVIHTQNGGVTAARRKGVEIAEGKYIVFVDADDQLMPNTLNVLYEKIEHTKADEVIGRFIIKDKKETESPLVYQGEVTDLTPLVKSIVANKNQFPILWGLICRKDLVKDCLDTPREIIEGEDLLMQLKILMKHPRVFFISNIVYVYYGGVPNNRKRTLEHEKSVDAQLRQVLAREWKNYQSVYVLHQIKQYEEFIVRREYSVRNAYYQQAIPSPLPEGIPLLRRFIWYLPPVLGRIAVMYYRKMLAVKKTFC